MVDPFRGALESLYTGLCDVFEYTQGKDPVTKITGLQETRVIQAQPCRVSYKSKNSAKQGDAAANLSQTIILHLAPELDVRPGSKIVVTQNGRTTAYKSAGQPAVYSNHQEVPMELWDERA